MTPFCRGQAGRSGAGPGLLGRRLRRLFREVGALDLARLEDLEDVALAEVVEALEQNPALEALGDLAHVVLEALELRDRRLVDDGAVAHDSRAGATADDVAGDVGAGDRAQSRDAEELPHLGLAERLLRLDGPEHADERLLDVLRE